jgi:hypothetical protein
MRDGSTHESVKLFLGEPEGAFWEDRYHATAVEHSAHLFRCLVYIDLNMVRAGVVTHPSEWPFSGHGEIQEPRQRYALIYYEKLQHLLGIESYDQLKDTHRRWVEESLTSKTNGREHKWAGATRSRWRIRASRAP